MDIHLQLRGRRGATEEGGGGGGERGEREGSRGVLFVTVYTMLLTPVSGPIWLTIGRGPYFLGKVLTNMSMQMSQAGICRSLTHVSPTLEAGPERTAQTKRHCGSSPGCNMRQKQFIRDSCYLLRQASAMPAPQVDGSTVCS